MRRHIILTAASILAAIVLLFVLAYRPWALTWGATTEEVRRAMAGDNIVSDPTFIATRAISINAPPEDVWPWIIQMGYGKAGFYSYDRLDNAGIPSAERILREYQGLKVGDEVPLGGRAGAKVVELLPNERLVLHFQRFVPFTWAWQLDRRPGNRTRLVSRIRWQQRWLPRRIFLDAAEIWMMRKCILGIQQRAESARGKPAAFGS